jgi:hypothetical protein
MPDSKFCIVCGKPIRKGLYDEPLSEFCNTVCAVWFARAVANNVFLDGDSARKIENWLRQFVQVRKKRGLPVNKAGATR